MGASASYRDIFISHDAVGDAALAGALLDLLWTGVGVTHAQVFCTSEKGLGAEIGQGFSEDILQRLTHAKVVIAIITENFWGSPFCVGEIGGVWYDRKKPFVPLLIPPLGFADLRGVVDRTQALKANDKDDLDLLRDRLIELKIAPGVAREEKGPSTATWGSRRDVFLAKLPEMIKKCPTRAPPPRADFEKLKKELAGSKVEYAKLDARAAELNATIAELSAIKEPKAVANVIAKHSKASERFEALAKAAHDALADIPRMVRIVLFHRESGEEFRPSQEDEEDIATGVKKGYLTRASEGEPVPREGKKEVAAAMEALEALRKFLHSPPKGFEEWYAATFDEEEPDLALLPFWDQHLVRSGSLRL